MFNIIHTMPHTYKLESVMAQQKLS